MSKILPKDQNQPENVENVENIPEFSKIDGICQKSMVIFEISDIHLVHKAKNIRNMPQKFSNKSKKCC